MNKNMHWLIMPQLGLSNKIMVIPAATGVFLKSWVQYSILVVSYIYMQYHA